MFVDMWYLHFGLGYFKKCLNYSTVTQSSRIVSNLFKKNEDIIFPKKLLNKKHNYSEHIYINNLNAAKIIAKNIQGDIPENSTILEINPGNGFLTSFFFSNKCIKKILLFETYADFLPRLKVFSSIDPDRIEIKQGDFFNLRKLAFRDKCDNGCRLLDLLQNVPKINFTDDVNIKVFGAVGSSKFFKHLINSLAFNTSLYLHGRFEMYLVVPPPLYIHFTCSKKLGYFDYRATSVLFQIMFEHKFFCKIPKTNFFPTLYENSSNKKIKKKIKSIDSKYLYLVKIVPRKNLYELCSLEDMTALWYFVKQTLISRKKRVIPLMEKWAPGCGPRLIVTSKKRKPVTNLYEGVNKKDLPMFSEPCTTMSTEDYYPSLNIYTEFGELSPSQMLTLFLQFRNWPEYKESPFLASLENSLQKMEESNEESIDVLEIVDEDDNVNIHSKEFKSNAKNEKS